jgi:flotillin
MTLTIESPDVYTKEGVPISLTGIAQVKVNSNNAEMISLACEHFLCKTEADIVSIVEETLEGHQREIMASMTVESIYRDRKQFSKQVYQVASSGLSCMGKTDRTRRPFTLSL